MERHIIRPRPGLPRYFLKRSTHEKINRYKKSRKTVWSRKSHQPGESRRWRRSGKAARVSWSGLKVGILTNCFFCSYNLQFTVTLTCSCLSCTAGLTWSLGGLPPELSDTCLDGIHNTGKWKKICSKVKIKRVDGYREKDAAFLRAPPTLTSESWTQKVASS